MNNDPRTTKPTAPEAVRPSAHIEHLSPYDAVSSLASIAALPKGVVPLKLDWNESAVAPSPEVVKAIQAYLGNTHHLNWYPDITASRLRDGISRYTGVGAEQVLVTNGSDEALDLLCRTFVDPGDDVVLVWPTYGHFLVFARSRGITPRMAQPDDLFASPMATLMSTVRPDTKLVYIASPNNPTGVVLSPDEALVLCERFPSTLFIVDEAYHEFCGITAAPLVARLANLAVTRTFSKCFGIAGLRVGYVMACPQVLEHLKKLHNPKSVNTLGQIAALAALNDSESRDRYIGQVTEAREQLVRDLTARGAHARATAGNYVLVSVADPKRLVASLETVGVFVRDRSHIQGFEGFVRITVGTPEQMEDLVGRLDGILATQPDLLHPPA